MISQIRDAEKSLGKVTYELSKSSIPSRDHGRSLFAIAKIKKGEKFNLENVRSVRPGYGLHPRYLKQILGKTASSDISYGTPLQIKHVKGLK